MLGCLVVFSGFTGLLGYLFGTPLLYGGDHSRGCHYQSGFSVSGLEIRPLFLRRADHTR
jgi:hypothetical protein